MQSRPDSSFVARKAARGASALAVRQVVVTAANVLGGILLARALTPSEFGGFAIVALFASIVLTITGTGLATNLIRRNETPDGLAKGSVFALLLGLAFCFALATWILAPVVVAAYGMEPSVVLAIQLTSVAGIASTFMVIPQVQLERELRFGRLAVVEIGQALTFNTVAVTLALLGFGLVSIGIAYAMKLGTGAVLSHMLSPWQIRLHWDTNQLAENLAFSVPFQGSAFVSIAKDSITPILAGILTTVEDVGFLTWASMFASFSILALMIVQRIYLPTFARLQDTPDDLNVVVGEAIWAANALAAPISLAILTHAESITVIVFGEQWLPALPLFYWFWAGNLIVPTVTPLMGLLNASGLSKLTLGFSVMWAVATWLIGAPLLVLHGAIGLAIANLLVQFSNLVVLTIVRRRYGLRPLRHALQPWSVAAVTIGGVYVLERWMGFSVADGTLLVVSLLTSMLAFVVAMTLLNRQRVQWVMRNVVRNGSRP